MIMPHSKRPNLSGKHWSSLQVCGEQLIWAGVAHRDDKGDLLRDTCLVLQQAGWYVLMTVAEEKEQKGKCVSTLSSLCLHRVLTSCQPKHITQLSPEPRIGQNILPQEGIAELLEKDG